MVTPAVGSVVLIPFPFPDLSQAKLRPAVALANARRDDRISAKSLPTLTAIRTHPGNVGISDTD